MSSILSRFDFRAEYSLASDLGATREQYEDAALLAPELGLFAVADGMGGHLAGEVAAKLAVEQVKLALSGRHAQRALDAYVAGADLNARRRVFSELKRAVERAHSAIRADAEQNPEHRGMGTTLDVVWFARDHVFIAHVGDGRVYLARQRALLQLTTDHTAHGTPKVDGFGRSIAPTQASGISNALGINDPVSIDTLFVDVSRGDRLLICSDGVYAQIELEQELSELLRSGSARHAAQNLIVHAARLGRDNATAIVIDIGDRFVKRKDHDRGLNAADLERARQSPLLVDLPLSFALTALSAAVEIEVGEGQGIPRAVANDLVAYIVLDGVVRHPDERRVGAGALLHAESLLGVLGQGEAPVCEQTARLLRVCADDFAEICSDPKLGSELYRRLAMHLARHGAQTKPRAPSSQPA
ncbi:MAG TPA: protein phosphatase 2C domain-containing protein [Polyangiaceae bacterium]|nr:protein phosphatase 2C domain-containing protein [Polyangiaceae bacterium]